MNDCGIILWRIPRTGTTSIRHGLVCAGVREINTLPTDEPGPWFASFGHLTPAEALAQGRIDEESLDRFVNLLIVRNPWDRLVSLWSLFHGRRADDGLRQIAKRYGATFPEYVDWCVSGERASGYHETNFQAHPQTDWIWIWGESVYRMLDQHAAMSVTSQNYIARFGHLHHVWKWLGEHFGFSRPVPLPHHNGSQHGPYQGYYTPALEEMVREHYACEIAWFGFQFGEA